MGKGEREPKVEHLARLGQPCLGICTGKDCSRRGAFQVMGAAEAALHEAGLADQVRVIATRCQDHCDDGPALTVVPGGLTYLGLSPATTRDVVLAHLRDGRPLVEHLDKRSRRRLTKRSNETS